MKILFLLLLWLPLAASEGLFQSEPVAVLSNPCPSYSLINSVDFHPTKNLFCVTYTQGDRIVFYEIDSQGLPRMVKTLSNPTALLDKPQHAVFSVEGEKLVVANWANQTITLYNVEEMALLSVTPSPSVLKSHRPHGIAVSPCGNFLAIAYGAAKQYGRAIAIYSFSDKGCELVSLLQELSGTPKGITFTPDGKSLLVTFSDTSSLALFDWDSKILHPTPRQIIQGTITRLSRPEDVKISPDGHYCAVTNSDQHTVTFYSFDKGSNRISKNKPSFILENPKAHFTFPHGIAFSPDGSFLVVTQFGEIQTSKGGDVIWKKDLPADQARANLYQKRR